MHGGDNYNMESRVLFKNCTAIIKNPLNVDNPSEGYNYDGIYINHFGNGQDFFITMEGCCFPSISYRDDLNSSVNLQNKAHTVLNMKNYVYGHGNKLSVIQAFCPQTLVFESNADITIDKTSSAYSDLIGDVLYNIAAHNSKAIYAGTEIVGGSRSWNVSLGIRLGDCSTNNKTLVVNIGGNNITILFNEDYTNMNNNQVLTKINQQLNSYAAAKIGNPQHLIVFDDMCIIDNNVGLKTIMVGDIVAYDYANCGIKVAGENDDVIGISAEYIEPGNTGRVIKKSGIAFQVGREYADAIYYAGGLESVIAGVYYKANSDGKLVAQSQKDGYSQFVGISDDLIKGL
jgi:hypothetical protein